MSNLYFKVLSIAIMKFLDEEYREFIDYSISNIDILWPFDIEFLALMSIANRKIGDDIAAKNDDFTFV